MGGGFAEIRALWGHKHDQISLATAALLSSGCSFLNRVPGVSSVTGHPASPWGVLSFLLLSSSIIPRKLCSWLKKQRPEQDSLWSEELYLFLANHQGSAVDAALVCDQKGKDGLKGIVVTMIG